MSTCKKSHARMPDASAARNCRHVSDARRGAGPSPEAARIRRTVPSPTRYPDPATHPESGDIPSVDSAAPAAPPAPAPRPEPVGVPMRSDSSISYPPGTGARPARCPGSRSGATAGARGSSLAKAPSTPPTACRAPNSTSPSSCTRYPDGMTRQPSIKRPAACASWLANHCIPP